MNFSEFQPQVERLRDRFGKNVYSPEFVKILWQEVAPFSIGWFAQVVSKCIGECRMPPLMPEFREHISREREARACVEKKQYAGVNREIMHDVTMARWIANCLDGVGNNTPKDLDGIIRLFGAEYVDQMYSKAKRSEPQTRTAEAVGA